MVETGPGDKLKVFISYSRRDSSDFAEELVAGLELAGFAPFLDRHDIAPGEPWEERLSGLIQQADTVVYVISPEAVKSERCEWEVDKTLALSKRLMPVVFKTVPEADIPEQLQRRQFVRFDAGAGFARPLAQLAEALRQDLDWVREHTRIGELASRWEARGRPELLLLRGDDIAGAQTWMERRKPDAPPVNDLMRAFVAASKQAEGMHLIKSKQAQRRVHWALAVAVLCFLAIVVGVAGWLNQDWLKERVYVWRNVNALTAAQERALKPKDSFHECTACPEMIVVPAGSFMMGSPETEEGRSDEEGPQHEVTIARPFAVSKFDVTFDEWDACATQGDCDPRIKDSGFGRGQRPVINLGWDDGQTYVAWLGRVTGKPYRLLTEAEWEYAARAGTTTAYYWGDDIGDGNASCSECGSQWDGKRSAPVGSFAANQFGLYDMAGNEFQWVQDCYHVDYNGAPTDGSAWTGKDCRLRVIRGGSSFSRPEDLRAASRFKWPTDRRNGGFRVGRTLTS